MNKTDAVKKGVETMKTTSENNRPKQPKVITKADVESLLENLTVQFNDHNNKVADHENQATYHRQMGLQAKGAMQVATAQLESLKDDTSTTN